MTNSQYQFETREEDGTLVVLRQEKFEAVGCFVLVPASLVAIFFIVLLAVSAGDIFFGLGAFLALSICYKIWRDILNTTCIRLNEKTLVARDFPLPRFGLRIDADEISEFYRHRIVTYGHGTYISYAVVVRLRSDTKRLKADSTPPTKRLVCLTGKDSEEAERLAALLGARLGVAPERAGQSSA